MAAGRIRKRKKLNYAKWGYLFIAPFFIIYTIFSLIPLFQTLYFSFFEYGKFGGVKIVNRGFCGFDNYKFIFTDFAIFKSIAKTLIIWFMGFVPQIVVSLLLAVWFTDSRLKIKGASFFKAVIYMPNLIMATALASLFGSMFGIGGPFQNTTFGGLNIFATKWEIRWLIAFINFVMWFGNTTILLMAGVMGIDESIFEAATIDGAGPIRTFKDITMPLLLPIFIYVFLTSLIGGIQMFDIPATIRVRDSNAGGVNGSFQTVIMYLNQSINNLWGRAGAISVVIFLFTAVLSFVVYKTLATDMSARKAKKAAAKRANRRVSANV